VSNSFGRALKAHERWILMLLAESPMHGYGLMSRLEELPDDEVSVGAATLYRALDTLADEGFIAPAGKRPKGPTTRFPWQLTSEGRALLRAEADGLATFAERARAVLDGGGE